ncbi:MAG: class I poly(R)-hydroxyalkanoic acid synthase [Micavibrio sp.]
MSKTSDKKTETPAQADMIDPVAFGAILTQTAEKLQPMMQEFAEKMDWAALGNQPLDPLNMRDATISFFQNLYADPDRLLDAQMEYAKNWMNLWQESTKRFMGQPAEDLYPSDKKDKRFKSPHWHESALFDFIRQSYLMTSHWMMKVAQDTKGLDDETRRKIEFYTKQFSDAMAPSNFLLTNPEVLQATIDSKGENLVRGFQNMLEDLERGGGQLKISTTDYDAFTLGKNIATTPGQVVYQNDLIQLIQYEPATKDVYKTPLLIVPPWINKYYILDLRPDNSLVRWLVEQGHTVFVVSWVNPNTTLSRKTFEDYMKEGILDALHQIEKATGEAKANVMGYCIGGTLLATTLAWLSAQGQDHRIESATFLTTLIDFKEAGDIRVFIDDAQITMLEQDMQQKGYFDARNLKDTFSLLRANDLIWTFVVNNYLLGKEPFPFDLLYWNDDSTNMPGEMHSFYLRNMYRDNKLVVPGAITLGGVPIDIHAIKTPSYFLSTKDDHIAPWHATYHATQMFSGPVTFTLSGSGHVAGVINAPKANKYGYWTAAKNPATPDEWFAGAKQNDGSWWTHWNNWIKPHAGDKVPARKPGDQGLKIIEPAPGSYVRMKAEG